MSHQQYGKASYWDERYTKDPEIFDWYQVNVQTKFFQLVTALPLVLGTGTPAVPPTVPPLLQVL